MRNTAVVVLVATALLGAVADRATAQPFTPAQDPAAGAKLFTDKGCVTCHALNGKGGKIGPDLGRVPRPRTFFDLAAGLWNHAPKMAARMKASGIARPALSPRESGDLAAYLFTVSYFDRPGNADTGQKLFTSKQCVTCHRVRGRGGEVGPALDTVKTSVSPISLAAAMWNHAGAMAAEMEKRGIERPTFKAGELTDLIAYINRESAKTAAGQVYVLPGRASEGMRILLDKGCLECHSASGRGEGPMNLADREAHKSVTDFAAAMWNKQPKMRLEMIGRNVAFRQLKPEEMADIVAFLYTARYFAEAGDPRNGVILAAGKGCLGCHGLFGEQGKPASDLTRSEAIATAPGSLSALWNHSFIVDPRPADKQAPWPTFSGKEMADLMAYLRSLKRVP